MAMLAGGGSRGIMEFIGSDVLTAMLAGGGVMGFTGGDVLMYWDSWNSQRVMC